MRKIRNVALGLKGLNKNDVAFSKWWYDNVIEVN